MPRWLRDALYVGAGFAMAAAVAVGYRSQVRYHIQPPPLHYSFDGIDPIDASDVALDLGWTEESRYTRILREYVAKRQARLDGLKDRSLRPDERTRRFNIASQIETAWLIRQLGHPVAEEIVAHVPLLRIDPTDSRWYVADLFGNRVRDFP